MSATNPQATYLVHIVPKGTIERLRGARVQLPQDTDIGGEGWLTSDFFFLYFVFFVFCSPPVACTVRDSFRTGKLTPPPTNPK